MGDKMVTNALCLMVVIFSVHRVYAIDPTSNCRKCKVGFYVKQSCDTNHDTICAPCTSGHFMAMDDNYARECDKCKLCPSGTYVTVSCSLTSDTTCTSCDIVSDSDVFRTSCKNNEHSKLNIGEGVKIDSLEENGSGIEDVNTILPKVNISIISEEELDDGSGKTILDIPSVNEIVLTNNSTIEPSTTTKSLLHNLTDEKDIFLPVSEPPRSQKPTTSAPTTKPITTTKITTSTSTVKTTRPTTTRTTTTEKLVTTTARKLDIGIGTGIKDDGQPQVHDEINVIVQPLEKTTLKASTKTPLESAVAQRKSAMSDDSDKVSIGIVIAVAIIAALVFFVIGFIAAKYCRRRRRTMKHMKSQNGHHNGSIPIIVDNKPYKSSGIYDEIGKEPNGTCSSSKLDEIVPVHAENVYAVPNKTKKTPTSDEIKFIDETTDDETENKEGERLLGQASDDVIPPPPGDGNLDCPGVPEEIADESSPMMNEIQSEIENNQELPKETDALMEKS